MFFAPLWNLHFVCQQLPGMVKNHENFLGGLTAQPPCSFDCPRFAASSASWPMLLVYSLSCFRMLLFNLMYFFQYSSCNFALSLADLTPTNIWDSTFLCNNWNNFIIIKFIHVYHILSFLGAVPTHLISKRSKWNRIALFACYSSLPCRGKVQRVLFPLWFY